MVKMSREAMPWTTDQTIPPSFVAVMSQLRRRPRRTSQRAQAELVGALLRNAMQRQLHQRRAQISMMVVARLAAIHGCRPHIEGQGFLILC